MNDESARDLVRRFGKAFFNRDGAGLAEVLTADAEWHFALGAAGPHGRVRRGVDGFLRGLEENDALFEKLRFEDVEVRAVGDDAIVMTYRLDGHWRGGEAFELRGIEMLRVRDGRIALKDVFWKQVHEAL